MTKGEIEQYVNDWMEGHEPDTFIKNEHGVYVYTAGPHSINLKLLMIDIIEDFAEKQYGKAYKLKAEKWDKLDDEISRFYREDDEVNDEFGDLIDIGEAAAIAFGYL